MLGNVHYPGATYTQQTVETFDHDFGSVGQGKLIPYGIVAESRRRGYIELNTSHDTSARCCDSVAQWWEQDGRMAYPGVQRMLLLCDGGGGKSATQYLCKEDLQELAKRLRPKLRVAHYPPWR